jgi:hypothetical protein
MEAALSHGGNFGEICTVVGTGRSLDNNHVNEAYCFPKLIVLPFSNSEWLPCCYSGPDMYREEC